MSFRKIEQIKRNQINNQVDPDMNPGGLSFYNKRDCDIYTTHNTNNQMAGFHDLNLLKISSSFG